MTDDERRQQDAEDRRDAPQPRANELDDLEPADEQQRQVRGGEKNSSYPDKSILRLP